MVWVHTEGITAEMIDLHPSRDLATRGRVSKDVRRQSLPQNRHSTVAVAFLYTSPEQTSPVGLNLAPESNDPLLQCQRKTQLSSPSSPSASKERASTCLSEAQIVWSATSMWSYVSHGYLRYWRPRRRLPSLRSVIARRARLPVSPPAPAFSLAN